MKHQSESIHLFYSILLESLLICPVFQYRYYHLPLYINHKTMREIKRNSSGSCGEMNNSIRQRCYLSKRLAGDQSLILEKRTDLHVFSKSLRRFSEQSTVNISFHTAKEYRLLWFPILLFFFRAKPQFLSTLRQYSRAWQQPRLPDQP
jgi:hypothetical protein